MNDDLMKEIADFIIEQEKSALEINSVKEKKMQKDIVLQIINKLEEVMSDENQ